MKIFVEKTTLEDELKLFQGIFEKKAIMEILQNTKVTATEDGSLELVATDLEIGLISTIPVKVEEPGTFTVNGRDLYELISRMPEETVEIAENNDLQVLITNANKTSKYKLLGLQSSDYPDLPVSDFSNKIEIPLEKVQSMINRSYYVISPELKFNLGGALLSISNRKIKMAATDGHRLSFNFYDSNFSTDENLEYIISKKTLLEILKIGNEGSIDFSFDNNNLFFKYKNRILSSRIIDQKFPNYNAVIPEKTEYNAIVVVNDLLQTLRRILVFKTRNNGVLFRFSKNKLVLERTTPEKGEGYDEIPIEYEGDTIDVGFNGNFIIDFLTHVESEKALIGMNDSESSFLFKPLEEAGVNFIYIVMPLNL